MLANSPWWYTFAPPRWAEICPPLTIFFIRPLFRERVRSILPIQAQLRKTPSKLVNPPHPKQSSDHAKRNHKHEASTGRLVSGEFPYGYRKVKTAFPPTLGQEGFDQAQ